MNVDEIGETFRVCYLFLFSLFFRDAGHVMILQPQFSVLYTWDDPTKSRRLLWKPYLGVDDSIEAPVCKVFGYYHTKKLCRNKIMT
jgi:hypothetical protein